MVWQVAAAVIGAGAKLYGAHKDRKAMEKANAANRPKNQVKEWEKAGINPLVGITQGNFIPHQAALVGDAYASAGGEIANYMNQRHEDELAETALAKENEELKEQLAEAMRPPAPRSYMDQIGVGVVAPRRGAGPASGAAGGLPEPAKAGEEPRDPYVIDPDNSALTSDLTYDPMRTVPVIGGQPVDVDERFSDAEVVEQRYGDVGSWVYGIGVGVADAYKHFEGSARTQRVIDDAKESWDILTAPISAVSDFATRRLPEVEPRRPHRREPRYH